MAMNEVMMTYNGEILQAKTCLKNLFSGKAQRGRKINKEIG
jgi:hypothetical protein